MHYSPSLNKREGREGKGTRRRKNEIAKGYIFASILHNISETHSKWTNDLFHRMRHEGFVSHVRTKNRRTLHIYSIAVRPDKNDMAIEPEGMDRKEKGKGRLVKEGRGGNFANGTDFERQTQTSHTPPPTLLFTPFSPTSEKPPFIRSYHLSSRSLFFFCIIFTHRTKSLIFFPHTSFARSYHTLPLWQIVILQPLSSHIPFFSPPLHPFCSSSIPLTVQSSSRLVRHRWVFVWSDSDCGQNIYRYIFISERLPCDVFGGRPLPFPSPCCERSPSSGHRKGISLCPPNPTSKASRSRQPLSVIGKLVRVHGEGISRGWDVKVLQSFGVPQNFMW